MKFHASAESDEWYLPQKYVDLIEKTFNRQIDLDVASCEEANKTINAKRFYTEHGETLPWDGELIYCNPPFSSVAVFVEKLKHERKYNRFQELIFLCNASTSEKWFQYFWSFPICFTDHRIKFNAPSGYTHKLNEEKTACLLDKKMRGIPRVSNTKGQAFVYAGSGKYKNQFVKQFNLIGNVVEKIK